MRTDPKTLSRLATVALAALLFIPCAWAQANRNPGPRVVSPEVGSDGMVTFRILAPKAGAVKLAGSDLPGLEQGKDMLKNVEGVWAVTLESVAPGYYRYNFNVDGVAVIDPLNPSTSESNANTWSLVGVPGAEFMDTREVPHGAIAEVTYYSTTLKKFRRLHVYAPPGYEAGADRYPVFYLLHGAFDCDDSWSSVGRAGFILDNLIAARKAKPMVVVMPAGHTGPFRFAAGFNDEFERDFVNEVLPLVEKRYRVYGDRKHRAMAGLSMGGAQTLNVGLTQLDKFAYLGVFSSGVFGITGGGPGAAPGPSWEEQHKEALDNAQLKQGLRLFWFATGKDDFLLKTSQATVEMFRKHGFDVAYQETEGEHTWINWRNYLNEFAPQLFQ